MPNGTSYPARAPGVKTGLMAALLLFLGAVHPAKAQDSWEICGQEIARAEQSAELPRHLLTAISRGESGRWHSDSQTSRAWPWTVTAGGKGRFLPSKAAAIAEVERLRSEGVRNIDVGCMQINLRYHPQAFDSLETAFEPAANIGYAVRFLTSLRQDYRSWIRAIGYYHSRTPKLSNAYRRKVTKLWREERHRERQERRAARQAARDAAKAPPG